MSADPLKRITALLEHPEPEYRVAAAIVLGELESKDAAVVGALAAMAKSAEAALAVPAIEALGKIRAKASAAVLFLGLDSDNRTVQRAAASALGRFGQDVLGEIRTRLKSADAERKRLLDGILAELGGKDAFSTLLDSMVEQSLEAAKAVALGARQSLKNAEREAKTAYLKALGTFLQRKDVLASPGAAAAAVKLVGFLEDARGEQLLTQAAGNKKLAEAVRVEAVLALRFLAAKPATLLLELGAEAPLAVARAALESLAHWPEPLSDAAAIKRLAKMAEHQDAERARHAIALLARSPAAKNVLVDLIVNADRPRAELVAASVAGRKDLSGPLAKALAEVEDVDRAWLIAKLVRPDAKGLDKSTGQALLDRAVVLLKKNTAGWEAPLGLARERDPAGAAKALRALADGLQKGKKGDQALAVFRLLARSEHSSDDDRYLLAALELKASRRDVHPLVRAQDPALRLLQHLLERGYDVQAALLRDKTIDAAALYFVGFHFSEIGKPLGAALLEEVVKKAGRNKIGKMAKNRLELLDA